jgi:tRNA A37 threonylcarbamoyladenosine synthetase subunit TsaC/SUA5/YrdC
LIIDGSWCGMIPSTVIDMTTDDFEVIREGLGEFE